MRRSLFHSFHSFRFTGSGAKGTFHNVCDRGRFLLNNDIGQAPQGCVLAGDFDSLNGTADGARLSKPGIPVVSFQLPVPAMMRSLPKKSCSNKSETN